MKATIEHITRITDEQTGKVFEHSKKESIEILRFVQRGRRIDIDFRYTGSGNGDSAMNLREVDHGSQTEHEKA